MSVPIQLTGGRIPCRRRAARFLRALVSFLKHRRIPL